MVEAGGSIAESMFPIRSSSSSIESGRCLKFRRILLFADTGRAPVVEESSDSVRRPNLGRDGFDCNFDGFELSCCSETERVILGLSADWERAGVRNVEDSRLSGSGLRGIDCDLDFAFSAFSGVCC